MFDYTPFYRSSIGFDRLFRLLDEAQNLCLLYTSDAADE